MKKEFTISFNNFETLESFLGVDFKESSNAKIICNIDEDYLNKPNIILNISIEHENVNIIETIAKYMRNWKII